MMYLLFVLPAALLLFFLYLLPLARILMISATDGQGFVANYGAVLTSAPIHRMVWTTVEICAITTVATLLISYLIAYVLVQVSERTRMWMMLCILVPLWVSVLVRAFAWIAVLNNSGPVNGFLQYTGLTDEPVQLVRNQFGVMLGMVHYMLPFGILPLYAAMKGIDPKLISAARALGARPFTAFRRVFLPLSLPGLYSAFVIVFIFSLGFYVTPAILGGGRIVMIAEYIALLISQGYDWGIAAALATLLLSVVLAVVFIAGRFADWDSVLGGSRR